MVRKTSKTDISKGSHEEQVVLRVEADLALLRELQLSFEADNDDHTGRWSAFYSRAIKRLCDEEGRIRIDVLRNFWREKVFILDNPFHREIGRLAFLSGRRSGEKEMFERLRKVLRSYGCRDLLRKYPCPTAGNPRVYRTRSFTMTHRWAKHIYHLKRVNEFLKPRLKPDFVALDIGSGHGLFSTLLHQEYPGSHQVLVDLAEQLLLARYFLEMTFPDARIAGISELGDMATISREWLEQFDFVLLPWQYYDRLEGGSVDLMTSFAALGEMTRQVFNYYVDAPVFRQAEYFYTANPVQTNRMFTQSDLSLMDYPLERDEGCLLFGISPIFLFPYGVPRSHRLISYEIQRITPFFEYLGSIAPEKIFTPASDPVQSAGAR